MVHPFEADCAQIVLAALHNQAGRPTEALQLASEAEKRLRAEQQVKWPQTKWLARALAQMAGPSADAEQQGRAVPLLKEVLALSRQIQDSEMEGAAYHALGSLLLGHDQPTALGYFESARTIFSHSSNHPALLGSLLLHISAAQTELGEVQRAEESLTLGGQLIEQTGAWLFWPLYVNLRSVQLARQGQLSEARQVVKDAFTRLSQSGERWPSLPGEEPGEPVKLLVQAAARLELSSDCPAQALDWLRHIDDWQETRRELLIELLELRAQAQSELGDEASANATLRRVLDEVRERHAFERRTQLKRLEVLHRTEEAHQQARTAELAAQQLRQHLRVMQTLQDQLSHLSVTDDLTRLHNRRYFLQRGEALLGSGQTLALAFLDIDHFKQINDQLGHAGGDALLRALADLLRAHAAQDDLLVRLGGDEFVLVRPQVSAAELAGEMHALRQAFAAQRWPGLDMTPSLSIGVTTIAGDLMEGLRRADKLMYRAKHSGRNDVQMEE